MVLTCMVESVCVSLLYSEVLIDIKPDDGHIWPKHVVLILTLKNIHLLYII